MKPSDVGLDVGHPLALYPDLRPITGSATATILFSQLFYWTGKGTFVDGWIYKTAEEFTKETGLSYTEQVTARKQLVKRGLLEEHYERLDHKMFFRVNIEALRKALQDMKE